MKVEGRERRREKRGTGGWGGGGWREGGKEGRREKKRGEEVDERERWRGGRVEEMVVSSLMSLVKNIILLTTSRDRDSRTSSRPWRSEPLLIWEKVGTLWKISEQLTTLPWRRGQGPSKL